MANQATTTYKVTGSRKAVSDLWKTLQGMNVNTKNVWLNELADFYGIDYKVKQISVRGHIYWAEYEKDDENALLSFETENLQGRLYSFNIVVSLHLANAGKKE